jgi:hypothetical protein
MADYTLPSQGDSQAKRQAAMTKFHDLGMRQQRSGSRMFDQLESDRKRRRREELDRQSSPWNWVKTIGSMAAPLVGAGIGAAAGNPMMGAGIGQAVGGGLAGVSDMAMGQPAAAQQSAAGANSGLLMTLMQMARQPVQQPQAPAPMQPNTTGLNPVGIPFGVNMPGPMGG